MNTVGFEGHFFFGVRRCMIFVRFCDPSVRQAQQGEGVGSGNGRRRKRKKKRGTCLSARKMQLSLCSSLCNSPESALPYRSSRRAVGAY